MTPLPAVRRVFALFASAALLLVVPVSAVAEDAADVAPTEVTFAPTPIATDNMRAAPVPAPSDGPASTTPPAEPVVTTPPAEPVVTTPPAEPVVTTPPAEPVVTTPPAEPVVTTPPAEPVVTTPPVAPVVTEAPTVAPTSPRTSITTGGSEMMAALIKISTAEARCQADSTALVPVVRIDSGLIPASVGSYHDDQVVNAAIVLSAGYELEVPERAIVIAVMTAMGESSLSVIDEGEGLGPDNAGLFQQGAGGTWGGHGDRVDPAVSAANFYRALLAVEGWEEMEPWVAANAVQRAPADAAYAEHWEAATEIVQRLSQGAVTATAEPCVTEYGTLSAGSGTWVNPVVGRLTSSFGYRVHPVLGITAAHTGTDIAATCGTPVRAANDGIVVWSGGGIQGRTGNQVIVYHGDGTLTRYGHLLSGTVVVSVRDTVKAGDRIASVGGDPRTDPVGAGNSTGCHLHFETNVSNGGTALDPVVFMTERGVSLGR